MKIHICCILLFLSIFHINNSYSQDLKYDISADGSYVFGEIYSSIGKSLSLSAVRSTISDWYYELKNIDNPNFSKDGKYFLYRKKGTLYILTLGSSKNDSIRFVSNYSLYSTDKGSYLIYRQETDKTLYLRKLGAKNEISIADVKSYFINPKINLLFAVVNDSVSKAQKLIQVNLSSGKLISVWESKDSMIGKHVFSEDNRKLAFFSISQDNKGIWICDIEKSTCSLLISETSAQLLGKYQLSLKTLEFNSKDSYLLFYVKSDKKNSENKHQKDLEDLVSYLDSKSNYYWRSDFLQQTNQLTALNLVDRKIVVIEQKGDLLIGSHFANDCPPQIKNGYALLYHFNHPALLYGLNSTISAYQWDQFNFNKNMHPDILLVNLKNGSRKLIKEKVPILSGRPLFFLSPSSEDIVYFDVDRMNYFVYKIGTGESKDVSGSEKIEFTIGKGIWTGNEFQLQRFYFNVREYNFFWMRHDKSIIIQDGFSDLWKIFLDGSQPICITDRLAKKNNLRLEILNAGKDGEKLNVGDQLNKKDELLLGDQIRLKVYSNNVLKYNGHYNLIISDKTRLNRVFECSDKMINYKYSNNFYVWSIQDRLSPPEVFFGRSFDRPTQLVKQKPIANPVKQEFIKWKDSLGNEFSGMLLFPKDFIAVNKYPIIFTFYDTMSIENLLRSGTYLDYSSFRSPLEAGYLVFIPQLKYKVGYTSSSITNIIISAAKDLMRRSYVNGRKLGIFGGSFSGFQTNFILGQTNLFAAAYSAAGHSNLSSFIGLEGMDKEQMDYATYASGGQINMGVTLWERPDLYLASSPIFYADRVTCPVLLYHGRKDVRVPFEQGMEFYKALQANAKKVWLVAPDAGHTGAGLSTITEDVKAKQFFGHYLKDEPAPYWMTRPPLEILEKGLNPYTYDSEIKTPGEGIIPKEKTYAPQVQELLKHRTTVDKNGRIMDVRSVEK